MNTRIQRNNDATFSMRINRDLKEGCEQISSEFGLTLSAAITMFLKQMARTNSLPVSTTLDHYPNASTRAAIKEAEKMYADGKLKNYASFSELLEDLDNE